MCHLATWIGATCPWPRLSWRSGIISAFLNLFVLWLFHETLEWFPKRLSICSGSCPYFASLQPSGSEAAAVSPPAPIPPLPPHVPCLRWDSAHNDPVKKTQVICLRSTLHSLSPKQLRGDVGAPPWVSKSSFWYSAHSGSLGCAGMWDWPWDCVCRAVGDGRTSCSPECHRGSSRDTEGVERAAESLAWPFVCSETGGEWKVKQKGKDSKQFQQGKNSFAFSDDLRPSQCWILAVLTCGINGH